MAANRTNIQRLEDEAIFIIRESAAEFANPVIMYSIGKDSSVLLHLAKKAFYPSRVPFPLLHIDTGWKFKEMIRFRDDVAQVTGIPLIVHTNAAGTEAGIDPFNSDIGVYTETMKTDALKQAFAKYGFDAAIGGARRDEEKSRAKERIFSLRTENHTWDPKKQRPELWNVYNCRKRKGESMRVFPLSNWTELDVWHYIYRENISVVPLYFAAERSVVLRQGKWIMVDDDRFPLGSNDLVQRRMVRFRSLGCYPLSAAVSSTATSVPDIVNELLQERTSERSSRLIDADPNASMERKKREGYF
ncbi:sulfate adenylyltransferase subunit CysD [Shinella sumterensis]|uniref:sulfate adenylyltransferase subunit CysD n=1 Tax=Shinella sumterensis TaxID=1967501 RepID=UPI003F83AFD8